MNTPEFPKKWTDWILAHPDALAQYVFEWNEKRSSAQAEKQSES